MGAIISYVPPDSNRYIDRLTISLNGEDKPINTEVMEWMQKIEGWSSKIFTLSHAPDKYRQFVSKFVRRVAIARMAEAPDLASAYHVKLREAYDIEDKLKDPDIVKQSEEKLARLLDDAEMQLNETKYLAGDEFTMADSMFVPVLACITLLDLEEEFINSRPKIAEYYSLVKHRPSYKVVIGKYFSGWRKHRTFLKTLFFLGIRSMFSRY